MEILYTDDTGTLRVFAPDCTLRETPQLAAQITSHPVEEGSDLTDHIRPDPIKLNVEFEVTNHPIELPLDIDGQTTPVQLYATWKEFRKGVQAKYRPGVRLQNLVARVDLGGEPLDVKPAEVFDKTVGVSAQVLRFSQPFDRLKSTFDLLDRIRTRGITVSVYTSLRAFENMAIAHVSAPRDVNESILFSVEFVQIRTGSVRLVAVAPKAEKRGETKKAVGSQQVYELPPVEQSLLAAGTQYVAGLF